MTPRPVETPPATARRRDLGDLASHVRRVHHAASRLALARLEGATSRVLGTRPGEDPWGDGVAAGMQRLRAAFALHMARQETGLFPYLLALESHVESDLRGGVTAGRDSPLELAVTSEAHDDALLLEVESIEQLCCEDPDAVWDDVLIELRRLRVDLVEHLRLEREVMVPRGQALERRLASRSPES